MPSNRRSLLGLCLTGAALMVTMPLPSAVADQDLPGSELLTAQERAEYRQRMRGMLSAGQQDQIRRRYEALIRQRAKEQGVTLPGQPQSSPGSGAGGQGPGRGGSAQ